MGKSPWSSWENPHISWENLWFPVSIFPSTNDGSAKCHTLELSIAGERVESGVCLCTTAASYHGDPKSAGTLMHPLRNQQSIDHKHPENLLQWIRWYWFYLFLLSKFWDREFWSPHDAANIYTPYVLTIDTGWFRSAPVAAVDLRIWNEEPSDQRRDANSFMMNVGKTIINHPPNHHKWVVYG